MQHSTAYRRVSIRGHTGHIFTFVVQHAPSRHYRAEERTLQLLGVINQLLEDHKDPRCRGLNFRLPSIVPLSHHVRLVENSPHLVSLEEVFERNCERVGIETDTPIMEYFNELLECPSPERSIDFPLDLLRCVPEVV